MDIGERIKQIRAELGLSQAELGEMAGGVSKSAVSQWERGLTSPERDALMALRRKRGISPDWIIHGKGEMFEPVRHPTDDEAELLTAWGELLESERARMLAEIKDLASHNLTVVAEKMATYEVRPPRTVSMSERRLTKAKRVPFVRGKGKTDAAQ